MIRFDEDEAYREFEDWESDDDGNSEDDFLGMDEEDKAQFWEDVLTVE